MQYPLITKNMGTPSHNRLASEANVRSAWLQDAESGPVHTEWLTSTTRQANPRQWSSVR
jgi:phage repressor protein C with HTH and peptisase S24 domain